MPQQSRDLNSGVSRRKVTSLLLLISMYLREETRQFLRFKSIQSPKTCARLVIEQYSRRTSVDVTSSRQFLSIFLYDDTILDAETGDIRTAVLSTLSSYTQHSTTILLARCQAWVVPMLGSIICALRGFQFNAFSSSSSTALLASGRLVVSPLTHSSSATWPSLVLHRYRKSHYLHQHHHLIHYQRLCGKWGWVLAWYGRRLSIWRWCNTFTWLLHGWCRKGRCSLWMSFRRCRWWWWRFRRLCSWSNFVCIVTRIFIYDYGIPRQIFILDLALTCIRELLLLMGRFLVKGIVAKGILLVRIASLFVFSFVFNPRLVPGVELNALKRSLEELRHVFRTRLDTDITALIRMNSHAKLPVTVRIHN